ncbi:alpha/beta-hydrolase, partial [Saccharata proteae CBS 121410]
DLYTNIAGLIANSLCPADLSDVLNSFGSGENSQTNWNSKNPAKSIFPKLNWKDAPFSLTEQQLREVIYIPSTFTWGKKPPVILVPGTGAIGGENYGSNYIKLLTGTSYADPVWLNIPGFMLRDAQVNSEYVAYAINYIKETTGQKPSLIGWSQGNLDIQWAHKYWPSTRQNSKQHIAISPDYHGTILADVLCPNFPKLPCPPSVIQQEYNSAYITQLRKNGGDSAYIPTTNVFSTTDEVVQPQSIPSASAILNDARNVGVTNNELQQICNGKPAGLFYTHEGVLYNPVAFALAKDALIHGGPGQVGRIDLNDLCQEFATDGLSLTDVVATEGVIGIAAAALLAYEAKLYAEPALMKYATW